MRVDTSVTETSLRNVPRCPLGATFILVKYYAVALVILPDDGWSESVSCFLSQIPPARRVSPSGGRTRMLSQRSAIVTGAGRGIGAAVARLLGQHGASVLVNDLDEAAAQASAAAVTAAGKQL